MAAWPPLRQATGRRADGTPQAAATQPRFAPAPSAGSRAGHRPRQCKNSRTMAPAPLDLRLAHATDAPAMACLSRDHIEAGLAWRYSAGRVAALIAAADTSAVAAFDAADSLHAFAIMQFGDERAHLVLMCVAPEHRRRGVGRRLLDWLAASARVAGIAAIELELRADNAEAHAFYRAFGFADSIVVPRYYDGRLPALRMRWHLRPTGGAG